MKTREELHKLISETKLGEASAEYKCIRNKVNNRLKYEESVWQKARLDASGDNSAKTLKKTLSSTRNFLGQRLKI